MKLRNVTLAIAVFVLSSSVLFAANNDSAKITSLSRAFKNSIVKQITFPQEALDAQIEGTVRTKFVVTETGHIVITGINGAPQLMNPLKKQLEKLQLTPDEGLINKEIYLDFKFDLQSF
jgi:uncharacterized protein (DUF2126 family)